MFEGLRGRINSGAGVAIALGLMAGGVTGRILDGLSGAWRLVMGHLHAGRGKSAHGAIEHQGNAKQHSQED